jgi:hypothetical protein
VYENRVLRRTFGHKKEEVAEDWRRLHNEELHNLYTSPNNIRVIKSWRMKWTGHVPRMGDLRNAYKMLENLKGKAYQEDLGVNGRLILECILGKWGGKLWDGLIWLRIGKISGPL